MLGESVVGEERSLYVIAVIGAIVIQVDVLSV